MAKANQEGTIDMSAPEADRTLFIAVLGVGQAIYGTWQKVKWRLRSSTA